MLFNNSFYLTSHQTNIQLLLIILITIGGSREDTIMFKKIEVKDDITRIEKIIQLRKDIVRYELILHWLPAIRSMIRVGGTWMQLEATCVPVGLDDTEFRDNPTSDDYLVDYKHWRKRLFEAQVTLKELS